MFQFTLLGQINQQAVFGSCAFCGKKKLEICANAGEFGSLYKSIFKAGLAPFGLALTPNISLVIINLILQSIGDGSQPLMSKYYGEKRTNDLTEAKHMAYTFAIIYLPYYSDKLYDKTRDFEVLNLPY